MEFTPEQLQKIEQMMNERLAKLEKSDRYTFQKHIQMLDANDISFGSNKGTRIGTTTTQKIGFFNKTPIIQQTTTSQTPATFAANTSGISNDSATFDGYTIGDIVAILRVFGLIA